jgi:16S rRNA processing protein RimM
MDRARDALVVMGEVVGAYGVRGWLKVRTWSGEPAALLGYPTWWLRSARAPAWREFARVEGRLHSGAVVAALAGVATREAAQALKGHEVGVPRSARPPAPAGEIYLDELAGLVVTNRAGDVLGAVTGVAEHGAHPLLRVARPPGSPGPERLIPFVPAIVDRVDVAAGTIEVDWGSDF